MTVTATTPGSAPVPEPQPLDAPRWWGALAGVIAAACGLAVAELVAGLSASMRSPVVSVGDRVIDNVPRPLKEWAISNFGTNDKAVLLGGVLVILAAAAAVIGVLAFRRGVRAGLVGVGAFAVVGVVASLGRGTSGVGSVVPSLVAGLVAGVALIALFVRALPERVPLTAVLGVRDVPGTGDDRTDGTTTGGVTTARLGGAEPMRVPAPMGTATRRQFLGTASALGVGAVAVAGAGRWLQQRGVAAAERLKTVLPKPARSLPPVPAGADLGVSGAVPFITPNSDFYRIDTALTVPQVDPRDWTLAITGRVGSTMTLTYDELLDRPMVESDITLSCVSNEVGGTLVGNARWLGCRLDDLLDEVGIDPGADQIVGRSVDGFTAGFPTALLDGRDALVAVGMNGEPLPIRHGFPARLVVPGVYGYVSATKWLSEIELTTFEEFQGYWIPRGWAVDGPVRTQSRIDTPGSGGRIAAGSTVPIAGVAWAPTRGIEQVEVQIDEGPWQVTDLGEQYTDTTWRQWKLGWTPNAGSHTIRVRATDGDGETQTSDRRPVAPDGATGWHTIAIDVG